MEPNELRYREFKRSVRGYSPDEVDDLIDSAADEIESLRTEQARLTAELDEARASVEQYESPEGVIRATLVQAEKAAGDYQEAARREAEVIIQDAEAKARRMLAETSSKVQRVQESYEALQETRDGFDFELRRLLEGYLRHLDEANSANARELEAPLLERLDTEAISAAHAAAEEERREQNGDEGFLVDQEDTEDTRETTGRDTGEESVSGEATAHETEPSIESSESSSRGRFLRRHG